MTIWTQQQREDWEASRWDIDEPDQQPEPGSLMAALWAAADAVDALYANEYARIHELQRQLVRWMLTGRGAWTDENDAELDELNALLGSAHLEADAKTRAEWTAAHVTDE